MVMLYLVVRTLLPLLAFVLAWWLLSRLIKARVARLPRVPLNLPEHSSSPRRKDRRIYARKLRRKPGLRTAIGYPGTVVEVQVPVAAQSVVLQAWQPALAQLGRPTAMRYPIARTGGEHEAHAVVPVQVRLLGDRMQVAIARPVDAEMLRAELARLAGLPVEAINVQQRDIAPWREAGWQPLSRL
ncbi:MULTISPECIES: hypothetical protein [Stenotrophomonas]|uniref:hypothetical protein n=1 Tax=Stenotrophomonas TaxID=40323 RepID=UPI0018D4A557|nr:hypothetical protein [Stenotrophomonas maltophilia]MBA2131376.1 hypothetical protein [Stenotrophomonas maltophilia]MBH1682736.1 hypothetical protein [Stenotrophomonas maltophilia]MBH1876055.1 hypothetical protein [Stenotrophomonas maltophilia]